MNLKVVEIRDKVLLFQLCLGRSPQSFCVRMFECSFLTISLHKASTSNLLAGSNGPGWSD